ncbi:MAG TPA: murein L,D-transpeptidase catalytic domain family protein [Chitinophagaceae bacterium]|nr:murein L,D-transpeptidase catalytic domain family protein [Chitinophagaceae bacterium]HNA90804.1 murein L,D-transpeptidase catalytic domain family protein [Chitinophagaceae bacterium]HNA97102.1 murein L,D-transpeptidase catalytic domain family protein [Chitinophagaceae bacterium]HND94454.1 murein L,D-transpeptidase catalytic domain family protein [Chitinophagaceae bacterium]HNF37222.1 murein L,D-transpeptidase catalytic domain family protein [Chitinophagaceae bacterium]
MKVHRLILVIIISCFMVSWFPRVVFWKHIQPKNRTDIGNRLKNDSEKKLIVFAAEAKKFTKENGYNQQTVFFIEVGLPSGHNRFFIYNLKKDSVTDKGLVAHGNCYEYWLEGRKYSNVVGSGCTSLGKYKIGKSYIGKWGYSYKLHGLDSTNNKAYERTVVLHSHSCVPNEETDGEICQSNGCPTVSPDFLVRLKKIINTSKKSILLWIYE